MQIGLPTHDFSICVPKLSTYFANPKSPILYTPSWIRIFAGFKSLCTIFSCTNCVNPHKIWLITSKASSQSILPLFFSNSLRSPFLQNSVMIYRLFLELSTSLNLMILGWLNLFKRQISEKMAFSRYLSLLNTLRSIFLMATFSLVSLSMPSQTLPQTPWPRQLLVWQEQFPITLITTSFILFKYELLIQGRCNIFNIQLYYNTEYINQQREQSLGYWIRWNEGVQGLNIQLMSTLRSTLKRTSQPPPNYEIPEFTPHAPEVIDMFQSQYTENLPDRKANAIIKYSKLRANGFFYEEIEDLTKIVKYAEKDLFAGVTEMFQALHSILEIGEGGSFFNKRRSSDQLKFMPLLPGFFNSLEPLINYQEYIDTEDPAFQKLRYAVINFVNRYSYEGIPEILKAEESFENKKSEGVEISPLQSLREYGTKNLQALLQTNLIDALLKLPSKYQNDWEFLYSLISAFSYLMKYKKFAGVLCEKDILKLVMDVIFLCEDFRSDIVKLCLEIIWNAIEGIGVQVVLNLVNQETIFQLKNLFKTIMAEGYKLEDSCLRNQLLVLVNYLLSIPESIPFFLDRVNLMTGEEEYSFFENLLGCASVDEETFYSTKNRVADKKPEFGTTIEDLEFKKLIWSGILTAMQSNYPQIIQIIQEAQFLKHLLLYIDPMANSYAVNRWSDPQIREIQLHCLSILSNIVLYMKNHFQEKKGLFCLSKFLASTNDQERRQKCLKAFNNASLFQEAYKLKIAEEGVIDQIIGFLQHEDENSLEIRELCFSILANLCRECKPNKKAFREKGGIDIVIRNLKDPNIIASSRYALLAFSVLTCLWNSILGSKRSEGLFLDGEGLYVLLEFLEECDTMHRKMGLSSVSYLIQNQKTVLFFNEWNSTKTMKNAPQLLISIYQEQDQRFGVKYNNGMIKNKDRPLIPNIPNPSPSENSVTSVITQKQTAQLIESGGESYLTRKIKQKVGEYDLRAIIFSILYRTGFSKDGLHAQEQQRIEVIQMYPNFKIGEIWGDIKKELEQEGVKPTTEDEHWMRTSIEEFEEEMSNCINTQALINREYSKVQETELGKFYETIKNSRSK